jgi:hypothetical protein
MRRCLSEEEGHKRVGVRNPNTRVFCRFLAGKEADVLHNSRTRRP